MMDKAEFMRNADVSGDCWLWTGNVTSNGYGRFQRNGKAVPAHRFSFELHHRKLEPGELVMHSCDVRHCVNPAHLSAGTQKQNIADAMNKGRMACQRPGFYDIRPTPRGADNARSKLDGDAVRLIRELRSRGWAQRVIGLVVGTPQTNVSRILRGRTWSHIG